MLASILIICFSSVLLAYWFRYSCLLLLRDRAVSEDPVPTIQDPRFSFADVRTRLTQDEALDPLQRSLRRDYEVLTYLVEHASGLSLRSVEDRLLVLDYRVMQLWYRVTKALFPRQARNALSEMASILAVLSQKLNQQADLSVGI